MEIGRRTGSSRSTLSQINVTPFVDVMLVLLVIFMITAPMMEKGLDVNLPQVKGAPDLRPSDKPLLVSVTPREIRVDNQVVSDTDKLAAVLRQIVANRPAQEVFLQADRDLPYGRVVQVMAAIRNAGVQKVGMVAQEQER